MADVERSATLWDPQDLRHARILKQRAAKAAAACSTRIMRQGGTTAVSHGGWCLGPLRPIPAEDKVDYTPVNRELPDGHIPADLGIVTSLLSHVLRKSVGRGFHSLNDFGAGVGQLGRELLAREPSLQYSGFDGAGNVVERSGGLVGFFDLTMPLSLPRADWLICLEAC